MDNEHPVCFAHISPPAFVEISGTGMISSFLYFFLNSKAFCAHLFVRFAVCRIHIHPCDFPLLRCHLGF